jgi:hypothetical protein
MPYLDPKILIHSLKYNLQIVIVLHCQTLFQAENSRLNIQDSHHLSRQFDNLGLKNPLILLDSR